MAQETIEETRRRLAMAGGGDAVRQRASRAPVLIAVIVFLAVSVLVVVVFGVAGAALVNASSSSRENWSGYPGTDALDAAEVLANENLEAAQVIARDMTTEVQRDLAGHALRWEREEKSSVSLARNGYGGTSMLYDFEADIFIGQVLNTRPAAAQTIIERFESTMASYPGFTTVVANVEADAEESSQLFGSSLHDEQALWSAVSSEADGSGIEITIEVFDAEKLTVDEFTAPAWIPVDAYGTLFVRITAEGHGYLDESDREAFIAALQPYEDRVKPD